MNKTAQQESVYDITIRLFIILLIVGWCLLIMYPFASIILWSLILALAFYPLHSRLSTKLGGKPKLSSFIIIMSILLIIILPASLLINSAIVEVKILKASYDNGTLAIPPPSEKVKDWPIVGETVYSTWQSASNNLVKFVIKYKDQLLGVGSKLGEAILSTASGIIQLLISLVIAGVILVFGGFMEEIRKFFRKVAGNRGDEFADLALATIGSVVKGIIGEAMVIAMLNGIVFVLAGVPYAGIWTLLVLVLAIVQMPVFIVTVPVMIWFFTSMETFPAIAFTIGVLLVSFSDNILTPLMLGKGAPVPTVIIFIGAIGGLILSGLIGLFTGAIVMSLGYKLFIGWINSTELIIEE